MEENWDAICPFFSYSEPVRKIMYTTNTIENLNRSYRKYTKTKQAFPSDEALMKCLYLETVNITKKWNGKYCNQDLILGELSIMFEDRIQNFYNSMFYDMIKSQKKESVKIPKTYITTVR